MKIKSRAPEWRVESGKWRVHATQKKKGGTQRKQKTANRKRARAQNTLASGFDLKMEWYLNKNLVAYLRAQTRAGSNLSCSLIVTVERERGAVSTGTLSHPFLWHFLPAFGFCVHSLNNLKLPKRMQMWCALHNVPPSAIPHQPPQLGACS